MALKIQPSSLSLASNSTTQVSSKQSSPTDLFAQGMAAASKHAQPAKQAAPDKKPSKPPSTPKPKHTVDDASQSRRPSNSSSSASSKPQAASSATQAAANAESGENASPDDSAASAANAVTNSANARGPARTAPKSAVAADVATKNAADGSTDPSTDSANQSGLSLLQLLAKQLESEDTPNTNSTAAAIPTAADKTSADGADKSSDDPNAIALAMFSQALGAALARQQPTFANASTASGDATTGITSTTQGGATPIQDLITVLAHDSAADAKGKSDDSAAQFSVDPTKGNAGDASSTDSTNVNPNALTHLGIASHFAAQHLQTDTHAADLKSPVGSSAWQDEIGTHLTWMSQNGLETGSLRVSPEHLGPVEVNISVRNGDASVWFAANHPDTRAALEQALPRLREMFSNQGMNLADSGVSRQFLSQQGSRNPTRSGGSQGVTAVSAVGGADGASAAAARINLGLVDLYA